MKVRFKDKNLERLYLMSLDEIGKSIFSKSIIKNYQKRIDILKFANRLSDLYRFSGLNLEKLNNKKYQDCYSIRVNEQFRVIFRTIDNSEIEILVIELSKHYE